MGPKDFLPPKTEEEFKERAEKVDTVAARSLLKSLRARRAGLVEAIDLEINFYEKVLTERGEEV